MENQDRSGISRAEIEAALEALLADPAFQVSERNKRFLRFVVERYLEGRKEEIRAYAIATEVFGRPKAFDASLDPIVRIEATRLRTALKYYYETDGRTAPLRIGLPKGAYIPDFERAPSSPTGRGSALRSSTSVSSSRLSDWPYWKALILGFCLLVVTATAGTAYRIFTARPAVLEKPVLGLEVTGDGDSATDTELVRDALLTSLMKFERWQVTNGKLEARTDTSAQHAYMLSVRLRQDVSGNALWWQLSNANTGELLRSDVIDALPQNDSIALSDALRRLADWLGGSRGVVNAVEISRFGTKPPLGYGCIAWMEAEMPVGENEKLTAVRRCLEQTLRLKPDEPSYLAALARVLLRSERIDEPQRLSPTAMELAERASQLAPYSSQALWALAIATYRDGNVVGAADISRRAMEMNPNDLSLRAFAGLTIFQSGKFDEGAELIISSRDPRRPSSPEADMILVLNAYRLSNFNQVVRLTADDDVICFCTIAARAGAFAKLGRMSEAKREVDHLVRFRPSVATDFTEAMTNRGMPEQITLLLKDGLAKAGLVVN